MRVIGTQLNLNLSIEFGCGVANKFQLVVTIVVMLHLSLSTVNFWVRPAFLGSFCTFPGKGQGASGQAEGQTTARILWPLSRHGLRPSKVDGQSTGMSLVWDRFASFEAKGKAQAAKPQARRQFASCYLCHFRGGDQVKVMDKARSLCFVTCLAFPCV